LKVFERKDEAALFGILIRNILLALAAIGMTLVSSAHAIDVSGSTHDLGPFGVSNSVYLSGPVESGDAEKVWNVIRSLDVEKTGAALNVTINSPGGSVSEALEIGRLLNKLPRLLPITVTSAVGVKGQPVASPGDCASACVLIYLGATYRFLSPGSRIGVHQFSFQDGVGISSNEATSVSQLLAADITEYLREVRVDPELFSTMSKTSAENIHWVDHAELRRMRVLNEFVQDQSSEYKNADGFFYLLLWQQSYWGENKIVAGCPDGNMQFVAYLQPPDLARIASMEHQLTVLVDGEEFTPASRTRPTPTARFAEAAFSLDAAQLARIVSAKRVGARMMVPGEEVFFGFEMDLSDSKLRETILGCAKSSKRKP
jgi:hypothetical protein